MYLSLFTHIHLLQLIYIPGVAASVDSHLASFQMVRAVRNAPSTHFNVGVVLKGRCRGRRPRKDDCLVSPLPDMYMVPDESIAPIYLYLDRTSIAGPMCVTNAHD